MDIQYKILLIEKNKKTAYLIKQWLQELWDVTHLEEAVDVKKLDQSQKWNLVIIDTEFITEDEVKIITFLKSMNFRVQILLLASHENSQHLVSAIQLHIDGLLFKPLEQSTFIKLASDLNKNSVMDRRKADRKIVLAIGAHPDDVEIGCGGALIQYHQAGVPLNILTVSRGEVGGDSTIREKESNKAAEKINAKLFLGYLTDTQISDGSDTIRLIESVIEKVKPTHVYTHSQHDHHQDHRNVYSATMVACRTTPNVYCYQSPSSTMEFKPNLFIDISKYINDKMKLIYFYQSQAENRLYLKEDMIVATARYWGRYANYNLVEPMEIIRNR